MDAIMDATLTPVYRGEQSLSTQESDARKSLNSLLSDPPMPSYLDFIDDVNLTRLMYLATGPTGTAGYSVPNPPEVRQTPSHFVLDAQLTQKMRRSLTSYLTANCGMQPVPDGLVTRLGVARRSLEIHLPNLTNEATASRFFLMHVMPLAQEFAFELDGALIELEEAPQSYGAISDGIWGN
jgi:hypothetical protein